MSTNTHNIDYISSLLIDEAKKNGVTDSEVLCFSDTGLSFSYRDGKDETIQRYNDINVGLRVYLGKKNVLLSSNKISETELKELALKAADMVKVVPEDDYSFIASRKLLAENPIENSINLDSFDKKEPSVNELRSKTQLLEESALNISKLIKSDGAQASWSKSETSLVTSNGFKGDIGSPCKY